MTTTTVHETIRISDQQRHFFSTGATLPVEFRIEQLKKLKSLIETNEAKIADALKKDLHKSLMGSVVTEILLVTEEINFMIKNLKKWARPKKAPSPFPVCWPGRSKIYFEPYGSVLIISPWNYPFLLSMSPVAGALSAGNCVTLKPSEVATHTQEVIYQLINDNFPPDYLHVIKADPEKIDQLLEEQFDYLFFTGGKTIGKVIMEAAAKHLTPVTLELGGKSPCIVDETANLDFAARRVIWGKFMNAGQTCIAPDYLFIHQSKKEMFIKKCVETIKQFYGDDPATSPDYCRIINKKHFARIVNLMNHGQILFGGKIKTDDLYISPTLIDGVSWEDPIMQEEIFGPLLPILTYDKLDEVITAVQSGSKPLALYLFSNDKNHEQKILQQVSFGSGCINDCMLQIANYHLPFGGIGTSGIGGYHGKYSYETFSHRKSIFKKNIPFDFKLEYPPYSDIKLRFVRWLTKL